MPYAPVTIGEFKEFFARDFPYGRDPETTILDGDISKALCTAGDVFNEALWSSQEQFARAKLNLAAHYLVKSIRASSSGLAAQYSGNTQNKSVGNVSEAYVIPPNVQKNAFLSELYTTPYGALYVAMIWPKLAGNVVTICGRTTP